MTIASNLVIQVPAGNLPNGGRTASWSWQHPAGTLQYVPGSSPQAGHFLTFTDEVGLKFGAPSDHDREDYVLVDLLGGNTYSFSLQVIGLYKPAGPLVDLFDSGGYPVASEGAPSAGGGWFYDTPYHFDTGTYFIPTSGTYYIHVAFADPDSGQQGYSLTADLDFAYPARHPGDSLFGGGDDSFVGGDLDESVEGGAGADTILGMGGNDSLLGGLGDDNLNGNTGSDTVRGGGGADFVRGGQSSDLVFGDDGDDWHVNGNLGDDVVHGGAGNDAVFGGAGEDTITGDAGNDTLSGDLGQDLLSGGTGADEFRFGNGSGIDQVQDFDPAGGDVIRLAANINGSGIATFAAVLAHAVNSPAGVLIDLGGDNSVTLLGVAKNALAPDDFAFG